MSESSDSDSEIEIDNTCAFCPSTEPGRYTCPRCNARYCSANCYKSQAHADCSEAFYRECFMEGLREMESDEVERKRVMDMLRNLEDEAQASDGSDDEDLADRLVGVNLDGDPDEIWQRLTDTEKRDFEAFVSSGKMTYAVPLWTAWWSDKNRCLVQEVSKQPTSAVPSVLSSIPELPKLTKLPASDMIPFSIVNVLYGYSYTARLYNGDHVSMSSETAPVILDISESLGRGVFPDAATALAGCLSRLDSGAAHSHFVSREYSVVIIRDVCQIIAGPSDARPLEYVLAALSDCYHIFRTARKELAQVGRSSGEQADDEGKTLKQKLSLAQKKIEFLLSWAVGHGAILQTLLPSLELESCELTTQLAVYESEHDRMEEALNGKQLPVRKNQEPLISELPSAS